MRKWIALCCMLFAMQSMAAETQAQLDARVEHLSMQLRCLVCQNESIAESQADLAQDLRQQVREMLAAGKSEEEVRDYLVDRYGDFVLYDPPFKSITWALWLGPVLLFIAAVTAFIWRLLRRKTLAAETIQDEAALARARALLADKDEG